MNALAAHLRHRRLVNAARTLMRTRYPTAYQRQRLVDLWLEAGEAVS